MYFNSTFTGRIPSPIASSPALTSISPSVVNQSISQVSVLKSLDHPVNKRYYLGDDGQVQKDNFQNAYLYNASVHPVGSIHELAELLERHSRDNRYLLLRGLPRGAIQRIRKAQDNFAEHPQGTPWVMLDFDDVPLPDTLDPLSIEAVEWIIRKLPTEFHEASYFYQHSSSAGILKADGTPLKSGLNVHLFFWLNRRVPGKELTAYLALHCMETGFYELGEDRGGCVQLRFGIDPAPIRSEVQAHYIANPTIEAGVKCRLSEGDRQGLVTKSSANVTVPALSEDVPRRAHTLKSTLVNDYKRRHGYQTRVVQTNVHGRVALTRYSVPPGQPLQCARVGRTFLEAKLSADEQYLTLYFEGESTPGSWYVCRDRPQLGIRHGDGATLPLKELSQGAHDYVRNVRKWFSEVPHVHLDLVDGYLPRLSGFATAKVSLVLSPTGSGKTRAAIDWAQEKIAAGLLVFYAAPTIALVNQMRDDLDAAGLSPRYYQDVWGPDYPRTGVVVTTNRSLPRLLAQAYDEGLPHVLIVDEIHQALDEFMRKQVNQETLESALSKARQSLLLTGTLTDVQRLAIIEIAKHALGGLTATDYCCYEFSPFKRNPLYLLPTDRFDSDLGLLLQNFREKLQNNEALPRFVMLLDTSRMECYRLLMEKYGLAEQAIVVSRPENTADEIEVARTSNRPILFSSPLFGLGLNFAHEPDILWCRFDHVEADTNQIIQAVNRANRGERQCEVRIYGNVTPEAEFVLPKAESVRTEVAEQFRREASLPGFLEDHFQLDRVAYRQLRQAECNSQTALSVLVRHNAIQNFTVVDAEDLAAIDNEQAKAVKAARRDGRKHYREAIKAEALRYAHCDPLLGTLKLDELFQERKENWKSANPRVERDLDHEQIGIVMGMCGIADPVAAGKVKVTKLQRLFGERSPWVSEQYARERFPDWAKIEAEKTEKLIVLLEKLQQLKAGTITPNDLSASLTRNGQLQEAFEALASNEMEFQSLRPKFETLRRRREQLRTKSGDKARQEVAVLGLQLLRELLEPIGVTYEKKLSRGREVTDVAKPIVPPKWGLADMIFNLKRQVERLKALPKEQTQPIMPPPSDLEVELTMGLPMTRDICEYCVFFHQNACVRGRPVDWQGLSEPGSNRTCNAFKRIKPELTLQ